MPRYASAVKHSTEYPFQERELEEEEVKLDRALEDYEEDWIMDSYCELTTTEMPHNSAQGWIPTESYCTAHGPMCPV